MFALEILFSLLTRKTAKGYIDLVFSRPALYQKNSAWLAKDCRAPHTVKLRSKGALPTVKLRSKGALALGHLVGTDP